MVPPNYGGMRCALELRSFSHGYGQITYHILLVPKYRYKIFYERQVKKDCELIINDICRENGYRIHAMEIVEDHVHFFLEFHPTISLSKVVQYLKGSSSYRMFKRHPELKKRYWGGSLWSSGKFFRSVGNVTRARGPKHTPSFSGVAARSLIFSRSSLQNFALCRFPELGEN